MTGPVDRRDAVYELRRRAAWWRSVPLIGRRIARGYDERALAERRRVKGQAGV